LRSIPNRTFLACIAICFTILVFDANTPLGYAEWMLYLLPISLAFWRLHRRQLAYVASLSMILLGLGFALSPPRGLPWQIALFNRTTGAIMLSLTTIAYVHFKRMNDAQRESKEKYRAIAENSPDFIGILQDGTLKYVNRTAVERFGWTHSELASPSFNPVEKIVAERFRGLIKENIGKRLRGEETQPYEISVITKDGQEIPVILRAARITYQGRPAIEFVFGDITERKLMEDRLSSLYEHSTRLASATNIEQVAEHTLNAMERALGFSIAEFSLVEKTRLLVKGRRGMRAHPLSEQPLNGPGVAVKAANSRTSVIAPDTRKEATYVDDEGRTGPEANYTNLSELAVPVIVDGEPEAVMNVESQTLNAFTYADQQMLETLSSHVATALKRLRQEEELRSLARFPVENPSPVLRVNGTGALIYANDAGRRLLHLWGTKVGGSVPEFWQGLIHGALATGLSSTTEAVLDGRVYAMYVVPVARADYVNLYGRDVTEQKQAEQATSFLAAIVGGSDDAIVSKTLDGIITSWNQGAERLYGYSAEEANGKPISILLPPNHLDEPEQILEKIKRGQGVQHFETERVRKDGKIVDVSLTVSPIRDPTGAIIGASVIARDITERKRMQESLKESEQRFRRITENMLDMVAQTDLLGTCEYGSPAFKRVLGYDPKDMLGKSLFEFVHPDDLDNMLEIARKAIIEGSTATLQYRYRHAAGHYVWLESFGNPLFDENGKIIGSVLATRDITERKQMEETLRENEERFRRIFEEGPLGMALLSPDYRLVRVNEAFCRMLGYSQEELTALKFTDITHPEDIRSGVELTEKMRRGEIPSFSIEKRYVKKNGDVLWANLSASYIRDAKGKPVYSLAIIEDVSQRKTMEEQLKQYSERLEYMVDERAQELRESEERFRGIAERIDDVIIDMDLEKRITYVSPSVEPVAGYKPEEMVGNLMERYLPESEISRIAPNWAAGMQGKNVISVQGETLRKDGTCISAEMNASPILKDGRIVGVQAVIRDITERKRMEDRLVRSERLAAIGETAAMVGHDLRNPLQGIAGALYLLKQEPFKERDEMLQLIQNNVEYADAIVRDLSEYSGEIHLELSETTPRSLTEVATQQAVRVPTKVIMRNHSQDHPTLRVDTDRMKRVLINLIENAVEAMPEGGTLTITSRQWNNTAEIAISDTGSGMPAKVMENLWKPLQTTKAKGMGLGLAICKRIVDAHGGDVSVKSEGGEGTTVTIRLPLQPAIAEVKQK
jgi:PAS domain S-box-containing protein